MATSSEVLEMEQSKATEDVKEGNSVQHEESEKMLLFRKSFARSLDGIMAQGRQSQFKKHFQEIRTQNPVAFASITEQLMSQLRSNIEEEINLMIKQEDLVNFFKRLDQIVADNSTATSPAWRPSGVPSDDCRDHLMPVKSIYKEMMTTLLGKIEEENKSLEGVVLSQRARIDEKQRQLSHTVQHLEEAAELCKEVNVDALEEQAKALAKE